MMIVTSNTDMFRDRDVRAGEVVMSAPALITGPKLEPPVPLCVGCHRVTREPGELTRCPMCGLPLCLQPGLRGHGAPQAGVRPDQVTSSEDGDISY